MARKFPTFSLLSIASSFSRCPRRPIFCDGVSKSTSAMVFMYWRNGGSLELVLHRPSFAFAKLFLAHNISSACSRTTRPLQACGYLIDHANEIHFLLFGLFSSFEAQMLCKQLQLLCLLQENADM